MFSAMTTYAFPTRRMLLRDMGKAGLAIMVLGTAACATDSSEPNPTTSPAGGSDPTTATPSTTTGRTGSTSSSTPNHQVWHRVNMGFVSAYIIYRNGEAALIDTGVADSEASISAALIEIGLDWGSLGHVIVTHKHGDHQGSLEAVLAEASGVPWYAGAGDIGAVAAAVPGTVVSEGDSVFDLQVIETPGHTPGHISLIDSAAGVLISGDSINGSDGGVIGANPQFTEDMDLANASIEKLATFDYEVVLFGHGEPILSGGKKAVSDLATRL